MTLAQVSAAATELKSYEAEIMFGSAPSDVYRAIVTEDGVKGWLTSDCEIGDSVLIGAQVGC